MINNKCENTGNLELGPILGSLKGIVIWNEKDENVKCRKMTLNPTPNNSIPFPITLNPTPNPNNSSIHIPNQPVINFNFGVK
jgi:hypothetical protein